MEKNIGTVGNWLNRLTKKLIWWLRWLVIGLVFTGPVVQAQIVGSVTFTNLAADTTGGAVVAGGTWPARINGSVKASSSDDAVNLIQLKVGSTVYAQQSYSTSDPPVNTSRNPGTLVANLPVGVHDLYLAVYTVNGTPTNSGTFRVTVTQSGPANDAQFSSQSNVPASMTVNGTATATVAMKNTGTATWPAGSTYQLGSQNSTWGTTRVSVPASVAPGGTATFSVPITAPSTSGTYTFQWQMIQGTTWFGQTSTGTSIPVTAPNALPTATLTAPASSASYTVGSSTATVSVPVSGTGSDADGSVSKMDVLDNGSPVASANAASISQSVPLLPGTHVLRVRATDNKSAVGAASANSVTITIGIDNGGAVFSSSSVTPASGQVTGTNTLAIRATASVSAAAGNDSVTKIEVFQVGGSTPLATQTYTLRWSGGMEYPYNDQRNGHDSSKRIRMPREVRFWNTWHRWNSSLVGSWESNNG
jgi:hypothetical protein